MTPFAIHTVGPELPTETAYPAGDQIWNVANEVPIAFVYNRRNYAVIMASPADLVDFAVGFSLTERVIKSVPDIRTLEIDNSDRGIEFRFLIHDEAIARLDATLRRRNLVGSASCGLCGLDSVAPILQATPVVAPSPIEISETAIASAAASFDKFQPLNAKTRSVHAAAWVSQEGEILTTKEDIGRHSALDKLIGDLALSQSSLQDGFVLMSSRCSYEIVEKAATYGLPAIVSLSAPTAFAIKKAKAANLSLYNVSGKGAVKLA